MAAAEQTLQEVLEAFDFGAPVVGAIRYGQGKSQWPTPGFWGLGPLPAGPRWP